VCDSRGRKCRPSWSSFKVGSHNSDRHVGLTCHQMLHEIVVTRHPGQSPGRPRKRTRLPRTLPRSSARSRQSDAVGHFGFPPLAANCGDYGVTIIGAVPAWCRIPDCVSRSDHRRSSVCQEYGIIAPDQHCRGSSGPIGFRWCCASGLNRAYRNPGVRYGSARSCSRSKARSSSNRWQSWRRHRSCVQASQVPTWHSSLICKTWAAKRSTSQAEVVIFVGGDDRLHPTLLVCAPRRGGPRFADSMPLP